jgi:hypothetical protein
MVCCPRCGYQTVDAGKSALVRTAEKIIFALKRVSPVNEAPQVSHRDFEKANNGGKSDDIIRS